MIRVTASARVLRKVAEFEKELSLHFQRSVKLSYTFDDDSAGMQPGDVVELVASLGPVSVKQLMSDRRYGSISPMRSVCYHLMYDRLLMTKSDIAKFFGKDHSTVIYGMKQYNDLYETNKQFRLLADKIGESI